jgi:pre-mRNA-splicing factor RBM22/SLT11
MLLRKAGEMPSLEPPEDTTIRTLYVGGLDERITEDDIKDFFYAYGEIESIRLVPQRACAFVTYTTREDTEKAAENLANKLVIKGLRLKLMWGRPQVPRPEHEGQEPDLALRQSIGMGNHGGMLPRSVISHYHSHDGLQNNEGQVSFNYFNIPAERPFYPSMDPQRMGSIVATQEPVTSTVGEQDYVHPSYTPSIAYPPPQQYWQPPNSQDAQQEYQHPQQASAV